MQPTTVHHTSKTQDPIGRSFDGATQETANERMKRRSAAWLPNSVVIAVLVHFALFSITPTMRAAAFGPSDETMVHITIPEVDVPDPPDRITPPAPPVPSAVDISDDVTIAPTTFAAWTPERLLPPTSVRERGHDDFEVFVPSMVAPRLLNAAEVERALVREYPRVLRDAGIGGAVDVNLWLDEEGRVVRAEVARSSGYGLLDAAALKVVDVMRLAPARNRGAAVRVIVTLPVRFTVRS